MANVNSGMLYRIRGRALAMLLITAAPTLAATVFDDISITALATTGEEFNRGYVEYRLHLENLSKIKAHQVEVVFPKENYGGIHDYLSCMRRRIALEPGGKADVSLFQPPLGIVGDHLQVIVDGQTFQEIVSLSPVSFHRRGIKSRNFAYILMSQGISGDFVNSAELALLPKPAENTAPNPSSKGGFGMGMGMGMPEDGKRFEIRRADQPVAAWSRQWLGYSRYSAVVVSGPEMHTIPDRVREALDGYVRCGGVLCVIGEWSRPSDLNWQNHLGLQTGICGFGRIVHTAQSDFKTWQTAQWERLEGYWQVNLPDEWGFGGGAWLHEKFPVGGAADVPVRGLFVLMAVFAIVIGPVNLFYFSRKTCRMRLLWTVPLISLAACAGLIIYALAAEGWRAHIRTQAVTILAETEHQATSLGILGYYSPLTPGRGLHFSVSSELTPLGLEEFRGGRPRTIDWSTDQHFDSGWIQSRTPTSFLIRKTESRRERIPVRVTARGDLAATNGLGADIQRLWVADANGVIYMAKDIRAGAEAELTSTAGETCSGTPEAWNDFYKNGSWYSAATEAVPSQVKTWLRPHCYLAELKSSVFVEAGLDRVKSHTAYNLVYGIMPEAKHGNTR